MKWRTIAKYDNPKEVRYAGEMMREMDRVASMSGRKRKYKRWSSAGTHVEIDDGPSGTQGKL